MAWDVTGPTVTIDQAPPPQTDPTVLTPILFSVEFSEPVTGFGGVGDVVLSGTAGADSYMVSGTGSSYTVSVWGMSGDGTVIADVPAGRAVDTLGNPNQVATWTDHQGDVRFRRRRSDAADRHDQSGGGSGGSDVGGAGVVRRAVLRAGGRVRGH